MKKVLAVLALTCVSQMAFANIIQCTTSTETTKGSGKFDKTLLSEQVEVTKSYLRYILADGTVLRGENLTPEELRKVTNGTLTLGYSFSQGLLNMYIGTVEKNEKNEVRLANLAMSGGNVTPMSYLISNGTVIACAEQK